MHPAQSSRLRTALIAALAGVIAPTLLACGGKGAQTPGTANFSGPAQQRQSNAAQREEVSITVYNSNFGLVREIRSVDLAQGMNALEFRDVAAQIQPETVHVKSLVDEQSLRIFEQNYRYDLLSPWTLLSKYVGKKIKVVRWNEKTNKDEEIEAEVLANQDGVVLKIGGEITYGMPGRLVFPELPANLVSKPTLVWMLGSTLAKQRLEVSYLTRDITWKSDYVLVVDDGDAKGDLQGWVTLNNRTGTSYDNAKLKLVAGDVRKLAPADTDYDGVGDEEQPMAQAPPPPPEFKEEGFFEYHLYTLSQPTSVKDNEQKQISLLEAKGITLKKQLIFRGTDYWYRNSYGQVASNQKIGVFLDIENKEQNKLGIALPKGIVRVYKADKSGAKQFIGEDSIDHTPRDEKVRIKMGEAFDVVGDRKQTDWKHLGACTSESAWEISLRNHKDTEEQVLVVEPTGGDWEILASNATAKKEDAHTFTFDVKVPKRGETKITYRVRIKWC
jgi:hypothetical protein